MARKLNHERALLREKARRRGIENRATDARSDDFDFETSYEIPISPDSQEDGHLYELGKAFHFLKDNRFLYASVEDLDELPQKQMAHKEIMKLAKIMRAEMAQGNDEGAKSKCRNKFFDKYCRKQQQLQGRGVRYFLDLPKWLQSEICAAGGYTNWFEAWSFARQYARSR